MQRKPAIITFAECALPVLHSLWPPAQVKRCHFLEESVAVVSSQQQILPCASQKAQEPFKTCWCNAEEFCTLPVAVSLYSWPRKRSCSIFLRRFPSPAGSITVFSSLVISLWNHQKGGTGTGAVKQAMFLSSNNSNSALQSSKSNSERQNTHDFKETRIQVYKGTEKSITWKILNTIFLHSGPQIKPALVVSGPTLQTLPFAQITLSQHSHSISEKMAVRPAKLVKPRTPRLAGMRRPLSSSALSSLMSAGRQIHCGAWCLCGKHLCKKVDELNDIYIISGFSVIQSKNSQGLFIKVFFKGI